MTGACEEHESTRAREHESEFIRQGPLNSPIRSWICPSTKPSRILTATQRLTHTLRPHFGWLGFSSVGRGFWDLLGSYGCADMQLKDRPEISAGAGSVSATNSRRPPPLLRLLVSQSTFRRNMIGRSALSRNVATDILQGCGNGYSESTSKSNRTGILPAKRKTQGAIYTASHGYRTQQCL